MIIRTVLVLGPSASAHITLKGMRRATRIGWSLHVFDGASFPGPPVSYAVLQRSGVNQQTFYGGSAAARDITAGNRYTAAASAVSFPVDFHTDDSYTVVFACSATCPSTSGYADCWVEGEGDGDARPTPPTRPLMPDRYDATVASVMAAAARDKYGLPLAALLLVLALAAGCGPATVRTVVCAAVVRDASGAVTVTCREGDDTPARPEAPTPRPRPTRPPAPPSDGGSRDGGGPGAPLAGALGAAMLSLYPP